MAVQTASIPTEQPLDRISNLCENHLLQEEAWLTEAVRSLEAVRDGLVQNDWQVLTRALEDQGIILSSVDSVREDRRRLRQEIAAIFTVSLEDACIETVAQALPMAQAKSLRSQRDRTSRLARQVEQLNRHNAYLTNFSQDFTNQVLANITGEPTSVERYGARGVCHSVTCGSLLQARG
jgi:flagellar biosynthesis/type III secretory pathway chaperone